MISNILYKTDLINKDTDANSWLTEYNANRIWYNKYGANRIWKIQIKLYNLTGW